MIGETLKKKRLIVGLSIKDLAKRAGVTRQTISNIERGLASSELAIRVINYELAKAFIEMDEDALNKVIVIKA